MADNDHRQGTLVDDTDTQTATIDLRDSGLTVDDLGGPGATLSPSGRAKAAGIANTDVDAIVDALEGVHGDPGDLTEDRSHEQLPELVLPGFGGEGETCGDPIPHACDSCGEPAVMGRTCYRSTCSRCAPAWARLATGNTRESRSSYGGQVLALRSYYAAFRPEDVYYHHVTVSFREEYHVAGADSPMDALTTLKDEVKTAALELGYDGGIIAYHPFRIDSDGLEGADSRGEWKKVLFNGFAWGSVREALDFGPHFHVIGVGSYIVGDDVTRIIEDETGVVIHRITEHDTNVSIYGETDLAKVISYVLSHVGLYDTPGGQTRAAVWRFGPVVNEITPTPSMQQEMDYEARKVAPITLGLPYSSMVCTEEDVDDPMPVDDVSLEADGHDHHDHGHGSAPDDRLGSTTASWSSTSSQEFGSQSWSPMGGDESFELGGIRLSDGSAVPDPNDIPSQYLDVLEEATPQEIIDQFSGVTEDNVWEFRNELRDAVGRDVCGGRLLRADMVVEQLADPDWRAQADHVDDLVETIEEYVDEWADDQPHTPATLLLREVRDHFDDLPDSIRIDRDQVTAG